MKHILFSLAAVLVLISGCSTSDLEAYKKALIETETYTSGRMTSDLSVELVFDETGLTFEEIRDLSYFEHIEVVTGISYIEDGHVFKSVIDGYFNFGGLGFDMIYYINGQDILIKLPIMDKYIDVTAQSIEESSTTNEERDQAINRVVTTWNSVLGEEDVFSGSKAYIVTDKGQIKTTTYAVSIDEAQFEVLKKAVIDIIEDEAIIEAFLQESKQMFQHDSGAGEVQKAMKEFLDNIQLEKFEGQAFVDFDGRMVKQVFDVSLVNKAARPGDVLTMHISYETAYDLLGEVTDIQIPLVEEDDMLDMKSDGSIQDYFPEGLF